jgi:periplasmic protein TonB
MTTFEGRFEAEHGSWPMLLRWGVAGSLVLALHGAAAYALLNPAPLDAPPQGAPEAAILIDLAPPAESAEAPPPPEATLPEPVSEPPPPEPVAEPIPEPPPPEPEPEPVVEPLPEPVPPEVPPEPVVEPLPEPLPPEPVVEEPPPEIPVAEEIAPVPGNVPLPTVRPAPPRPEPERRVERSRPPPERVERRERRETPARQTPRRQAPQPPASVASRGAPERQASQGAPVSAASRDRWQSRIQARLNRYKRTPRGGSEGTVVVTFTIDGSGSVGGARVSRSGGAVLDEAALALVRRAAPYPGSPSGNPVSVTVPIRFN